MVKVWYYRPDAFNPRVNPHYVFDAKGKNILDKEEPKEQHPLSRIYKLKIKSSMVEVPHD